VKPQFVHLHNHTQFSLLDGACRIGEMVQAVKAMGMPAMAITDHGNLFGVVHFYKEAVKAGIRPVVGMEAYIAPKSRFDRIPLRTGQENAFHLILLATNSIGYRNLMKLSSIGYLEGFYYKPRIDRELLVQCAEGLLVLSSCIQGEIPYKIIHDDPDGAREAAGFFKDLFGDRFYLELQNHGYPEEEKAMRGLLELSRTMDVKTVATNDTHYLKREHAEAHDILLCIQTNKDFDDPDRMRFKSDQLYLKSPAEMALLFRDIPEALAATLEVSERCHLAMDFKSFHLPHFHVPAEHSDESLDAYFEAAVWSGLRSRYIPLSPDLEKRCSYEIGVIKHMGFAGYFLIVADFIQYARNRGIPVGPGRGSAAGSIVSYALGITDVDPIRYGLLFERFLNPERVTMPDIDIDFCYERRDEIIQYVKEKYGGIKNVTQIITFGSMNARAAIRDVGRVLKIPYGEVDHIAKMIPFHFELDDALKKVPDLKAVCDGNPAYRKMMDHARVLEGLARHASIHAAGVVIAPSELTDFVPLYRSSQGDVTTQYDMKALEAVGLLKMDFLGLRTLTVIDHTVDLVRKSGIELDMARLPVDDPDTFRIFRNGETVGIFQFESSGMRDYLKKLQPECIEDLVAMNALYRPGPMEMIDDFIACKQGRKKVEYLHPLLAPILRETHGTIVYQEQVMQIAASLGGFTLGEADQLRRAMGKKMADLMQDQRERFVKGAKTRGVQERTASEIFDLIAKFAEYGFNKSHAVGYSIIAYQTAYLKAHHPVEFMAANLTSEMNDTDRIVILLDECRRMGIPVYPPDVNESQAAFSISGSGIRFGLGAVKNVGSQAIESILDARAKAGRFRSLYDFCARVNSRTANKKVLESLIQSGAVDSLEGHRAQKMAALSHAMSLSAVALKANADQKTIFDDDGIRGPEFPELPNVAPWLQVEQLKLEKELLGLYMSGHPLEKHRDEVEALADTKTSALAEVPSGQNIRLCGIITQVVQRLDKKEKSYAFFRVEDFSGSARVVAFADVFEKYRSLIKDDQFAVVIGKADRRDEIGETTVIACEFYTLDDARRRFPQRLSIRLQESANGDAEEAVGQLKHAIQKFPGDLPLRFHVCTPDGDTVHLSAKKIRVRPAPELLSELRKRFGKDNVWLET
jgi:DNA polymerase-3 subunit alpha